MYFWCLNLTKAHLKSKGKLLFLTQDMNRNFLGESLAYNPLSHRTRLDSQAL